MSVARLAELLERRRPCVVLTGAGISTESGIPDFRSAGGIWEQVRPGRGRDHRRVPPRSRAGLGVLRAPARRARATPEPNDGHRALAELEERGWIRAVVTQNVDGLHQRAGSRDVVEVHGSLREAECIQCGVRVPMEDAVASLPLPPCPECGEVLKPGVVMFGELLPAAAIQRAQALAAEAGLLLVVGSSLEVHPVAGPARRARSPRAACSRSSTAAARPWDSRGGHSCSTPRAGATLSAVSRPRSLSSRPDRPRRSRWLIRKKTSSRILMAWLADVSEGAIQRLSEAPGADRVLSRRSRGSASASTTCRSSTRGLAEMEKRLSALEKRVDSLAKPKPARKPKPASAARPPKT